MATAKKKPTLDELKAMFGSVSLMAEELMEEQRDVRKKHERDTESLKAQLKAAEESANKKMSQLQEDFQRLDEKARQIKGAIAYLEGKDFLDKEDNSS